MDDVDEFGWDQPARRHRTEMLSRDLGADVEMMQDPRYIRLGERFGTYNCYVGPDGGPAYYRFVDAGPYLPVDDRPPIVKPDADFYDYLLEREEDERHAAMEKKRNRFANENPVAGRARLDGWMVEQIGDREPDVKVFCSSPNTAGLCWEEIGRVWHTPRGYYLSGQMLPFKEAIATHLDTAMRLREMGDAIAENMVQMELAWVEMLDNGSVRLLPSIVNLNDPKPGDGFPPWLVLGCPRHFNAAIDYPTMRQMVKEARKKKTPLGYNCSARMLGTIDWTASE